MNKLKPATDPEEENATKSTARPLWFLGLSLLIWFPLITLIHAWIVTLFWGWFVMPQFHVARLPLSIAAGLDILFGFLAYKYNPLPAYSESAKEKNRELAWWERLARAFVPTFWLGLTRCSLILLFGFIVHLFVRV